MELSWIVSGGQGLWQARALAHRRHKKILLRSVLLRTNLRSIYFILLDFLGIIQARSELP